MAITDVTLAALHVVICFECVFYKFHLCRIIFFESKIIITIRWNLHAHHSSSLANYLLKMVFTCFDLVSKPIDSFLRFEIRAFDMTFQFMANKFVYGEVLWDSIFFLFNLCCEFGAQYFCWFFIVNWNQINEKCVAIKFELFKLFARNGKFSIENFMILNNKLKKVQNLSSPRVNIKMGFKSIRFESKINVDRLRILHTDAFLIKWTAKNSVIHADSMRSYQYSARIFWLRLTNQLMSRTVTSPMYINVCFLSLFWSTFQQYGT